MEEEASGRFLLSRPTGTRKSIGDLAHRNSSLPLILGDSNEVGPITSWTGTSGLVVIAYCAYIAQDRIRRDS